MSMGSILEIASRRSGKFDRAGSPTSLPVGFLASCLASFSATRSPKRSAFTAVYVHFQAAFGQFLGRFLVGFRPVRKREARGLGQRRAAYALPLRARSAWPNA